MTVTETFVNTFDNIKPFLSFFKQFSILRLWWPIYVQCLFCFYSRLPRIAMAPDESSIICWHPEPEFPYEYTKVKSRCVFVSFVCGVWHVYMECTQLQKQCLFMHVMYNTITKAVLFHLKWASQGACSLFVHCQWRARKGWLVMCSILLPHSSLLLTVCQWRARRGWPVMCLILLPGSSLVHDVTN